MNTNATAPGPTTSLGVADDDSVSLIGPAFMDVRVGDADRVAAGQEVSRVRRKLRLAMVTAHAGRALGQRARDAATW